MADSGVGILQPFAQATAAIADVVQTRDDALSAIATVYRDLLSADSALGKVGRWLRFVDPRAEEGPPRHFLSAYTYAQDCLRGAAPWQEPSQEKLEVHRVHSIARLNAPSTGSKDADAASPRRHLTVAERGS